MIFARKLWAHRNSIEWLKGLLYARFLYTLKFLRRWLGYLIWLLFYSRSFYISQGVPCLDVIEGHNKVAKIFEKRDGQFSNILVMGMNIQVRVNKFDGLFGHKRFGLTLMLSFE